MNEVKSIILIKREEKENPVIPNNIPVNTKYYGWMNKGPLVGEHFFINLDKWGHKYFRTSPVTEIIDEHKFKTWNSIYEIVEVKDKDNNK